MTIQNKINDPFLGNKRFVNIAGSGLGGGAETASTKTKNPEEWRGVDAMANFENNPENVFLNLAKKAFPGNEAEQSAYAERINNSLENHLAPGRTMDGLWEHLQKQNCDIVAIIQGFLNFFSGKETKINIDSFFNVGSFSAELPADVKYDESRVEEIAKTQNALAVLLKDLQSSHPDLPSLPS